MGMDSKLPKLRSRLSERWGVSVTFKTIAPRRDSVLGFFIRINVPLSLPGVPIALLDPCATPLWRSGGPLVACAAGFLPSLHPLLGCVGRPSAVREAGASFSV